MVIVIKTTTQLRADRSPGLIKSIPPTKLICEVINKFLSKGISDGNDVTNTLFLLGTQRLIQEALEQEATDYLGREYYKCIGEGHKLEIRLSKNRGAD